MSLELKLDFTGENNLVVPRMGRLYAPDNTLAEIAAAGFLDAYLKMNAVGLLASDFVFAVGSDGHQIYKPVFNGLGSCDLNTLP